jgi:hypothetical protein
LDEPSNARGEHTGFSRPCPSQDEGMLIGQGHSGFLFGVQSLQHIPMLIGVKSATGPKFLVFGIFLTESSQALTCF